MPCASLTTRDAVSGRNPLCPLGYGGARPPAALALLGVA